MTKGKDKEMKKIEQEILSFKSLLAHERRKNGVFSVVGEGSLDSKIVFVGEAPGKKETQTGKPFCGASGKLLDALLAWLGIKREDVYITNIVKDRPTDNRDPSPKEIKEYGPFLDKQLEIIKPKVIATLGRFSMNYIFLKFGLDEKTISDVHGKSFKAKSSWGDILIIPFYHPAFAIYNRKNISILEKDFKILKKYK